MLTFSVCIRHLSLAIAKSDVGCFSMRNRQRVRSIDVDRVLFSEISASYLKRSPDVINGASMKQVPITMHPHERAGWNANMLILGARGWKLQCNRESK